MNTQFNFPLHQKLISAQGNEAVVMQRICDVDSGEHYYRIQFAPYDAPAQLYLPHMAHLCFHVAE